MVLTSSGTSVLEASMLISLIQMTILSLLSQELLVIVLNKLQKHIIKCTCFNVAWEKLLTLMHLKITYLI